MEFFSFFLNSLKITISWPFIIFQMVGISPTIAILTVLFLLPIYFYFRSKRMRTLSTEDFATTGLNVINRRPRSWTYAIPFAFVGAAFGFLMAGIGMFIFPIDNFFKSSDSKLEVFVLAMFFGVPAVTFFGFIIGLLYGLKARRQENLKKNTGVSQDQSKVDQGLSEWYKK